MTIEDCFFHEPDSLSRANANAEHWWQEAVKRAQRIRDLEAEVASLQGRLDAALEKLGAEPTHVYVHGAWDFTKG